MPFAKAQVPVNDLAILRGYAVFDFLKTVNGKPFLWREHWARFLNSARLLGLKVPVGEKAALSIVRDLLKKNKCADASFRLLLTGGKSDFFILAEELHHFPPRAFTHGVKLMSHEFLRVVPGAKSTSYIEMIRLERAKKKAGATEILFTDHGRVLECSTSNFFIVKKGPSTKLGASKLITAKADVLGGTVRGKVIELARAAGIPVEERELKVKELATADEAFLTATNKNVMPVVQIDTQKIGAGKIGPITRELMRRYAEFVAGY